MHANVRESLIDHISLVAELIIYLSSYKYIVSQYTLIDSLTIILGRATANLFDC